MSGEIFFDMTEVDYPVYGKSAYILKRWKKYSIYSKSGSYIKTDTPSDNLYSSMSIYLYDYVAVTKDYYSSIVYTSSVVDSTPSYDVDYDWIGGTGWRHREGTFRNTPNSNTNNYILSYNSWASLIFGHPVYTEPNIFIDDGEYFEIVEGYPYNHFTHKRGFFSLFSTPTINKSGNIAVSGSYYRNRQTINTTIGSDGLENGSSPVESTQVGNLNLIQSDNAINQ